MFSVCRTNCPRLNSSPKRAPVPSERRSSMVNRMLRHELSRYVECARQTPALHLKKRLSRFSCGQLMVILVRNASDRFKRKFFLVCTFSDTRRSRGLKTLLAFFLVQLVTKRFLDVLEKVAKSKSTAPEVKNILLKALSFLAFEYQVCSLWGIMFPSRSIIILNSVVC
jgi:hypothetical protein